MPAAVPHTSTFALTNSTFPYLLELASRGLEPACERFPAIREGVNTYNGYVTHAGVAQSQGRQWRELTPPRPTPTPVPPAPVKNAG